MNSLTKLIAAAFLSTSLFVSGAALADSPRHKQGRGHVLDHNKNYAHKHNYQRGYTYYYSHRMQNRHSRRYHEHNRIVYRHQQSNILIGILIGGAVAVILDQHHH